MLYSVRDNLLVGATFVESSNRGPLGMQGIVGVVWHWTGGIGKTEQFAKNLVYDIATINPQARHDASWHLLISREGQVYQSVRFDRAAWHAGAGGVLRGTEYRNINSCTIGIELENAGDNENLPPERLAPGTKFDDFPAAQRAAAGHVAAALAKQFKLSVADMSLGHSMFKSSKRDPGELWLNKYLPEILAKI